MDEELQNHINQLLKINNENDEIRLEGESYIENLQANNCFDIFRLSCSLILAEQEIPSLAIQLSFILINQNCNFLKNNWYQLSDEQKSVMRTAAMKGLLFPDQSIRNLSSLSFCLIIGCGIDTFKNDLFEQIAIPICNDDYDPCCTVGCFMALKELVSHDIIHDDLPHYEEMVQTITNSFEQIMKNPQVFDLPDFTEFLNCYSIILPFLKKFYYNEESVGLFLNLIFDVFHIEEADVHYSLYDLLFSFFTIFYEDINDEIMEIIFEVTVNSLSLLDSPEFIDPAITFWHNIAKFETKIVKESKNQRFTRKRCLEYKEIIVQSAPNLIEQMMLIITNYVPETPQLSFELETIENTNSISICRDAINCLRIFSALTRDIFNILKDYFDENWHSSNWRERLASIYTLRCISKTDYHNPDVSTAKDCCQSDGNQIMFSLDEFYQTRFESILELANDDIEIIRIEALSIIAMIFDISPFISSQRLFLKQLSKYFNYILDKMNKCFLSGEKSEEFMSDLIPSKICDIILSITKNNLKRRNDTNNIKYKKANKKVEEEEDTPDDEQKEEDIFKIEGSEFYQTQFSFYFFKFLRNLFTIFVFPTFQVKECYELQEKCSIAIMSMFKATPIEQVKFVLDNYLPIIFSYIESNIEKMNNPFDDSNFDGDINAMTRTRQLCMMLAQIINVSGQSIIEYVDPIKSFLVQFLKTQNVPLFEEVLITLNFLINIDVSLLDELDEEINFFDVFFMAQDSKNDEIIKRSAKLMKNIIINQKKKSNYLDQTVINSIFEAFAQNLQDEDLRLRTRLKIIKYYGKIILALKIQAEPFFSSYVDALVNYEAIIFKLNFLIKEDINDGSLLYCTIINGYSDLLEASIGLEFIVTYMRNFKKIVLYIYSIGNYTECMNDNLKITILNFIQTVLNNLDSMQKANNRAFFIVQTALHHKIKSDILDFIINDDNIQISDRASRIKNRIIDLGL